MSEQLPSPETNRSQPPASAASSDPASSLRAAALLTLKSKRRKPTTDQSTTKTLPSRPPPLETGFQLDYGPEDITSSPQEGLVIPKSDPAYSSSKSSAATPTEDVQMREEGEISDEENAPLPAQKPQPVVPRPRSPPRTTGSIPHDRRPTPPKSAMPNSETAQPRTRLSDRIAEHPSAAYEQSIASSSNILEDSEVLDSPLQFLDANHIRPGLAMNQAQYDTAKDIVLDLLGWGVPPEYFVDCGLTREIVYYVFTELNLRLPQNLDITGIVPYTPDIPVLVERQPSVLMPPPSTTARGRRYSQGNPSLPSKPHGHTTQNAAAIPPTRTELRPVPAEILQGTTTSNLHDMEQQRRQELLARKAAIASRKSKQSLSSSDPSASSFPSSSDPSITSALNRDVEMTVPSETVDDFLKSIGPGAEEDNTPMDAETQSRRQVTDDMDVDEIPGLGGAPNSEPPPAPATGDASRSLFEHSAVSIASENAPHEYPPSSADSISTAYTQMSTETLIASDSQSLRRGTKRPVASDFDLDLGPRQHNSSSGGYLNGVSHSASFARHRPTGFASVSGMRRCVIDLSDSEGEGDDDVRMRDMGSHTKDRRGRPSGYSSPGPLVSAGTAGGWMTPPVAAITPGVSISASMSPAVLAEKETEIRRMREMIAQRERDMQKKLAASRSISSIETNGPEASGASMSVKQEEFDVGMPLSSSAQGNGANPLSNGQDSATPPESATPQDYATTGLSLLADVVSAIPISPRYEVATSSNGATNDTGIAPMPQPTTKLQVLTPEVLQEQVQVNSLSHPHVTRPQEFTRKDKVDVDLASSSSAQVPQETAALPRHDANQDLSVTIPTISAQQQQQRDESFATYTSPFRLYPLLGSRSRPIRECGGSLQSSLSALGSVVSPSNSSTSLRASSTLSSFECPSSTSSSSLSSLPSALTCAYTTFPLPNLKLLKLATVSKLLDPSKVICQYEVPGGGICRDVGCEDIHLGLITGHGGSGGVEPSDQDTADYLANALPVDWLTEHIISCSKILSTLEQIHVKNPQMVFEERVKEALATLGAPPPPSPP